MRRMLLLLLVLLLLCGCTADPATRTETAPEKTAPATETAAPLVGQEALTADSILLYRQADVDARQGNLLSLEKVLSAPEGELLPRTHLYDDLFPGDSALWLRLLDYALANGYPGFSVSSGTLPEPELEQRRAMAFMYRIDGGKVLSQDRDGVTTVWYKLEKKDAMEKFSLGLAAARRIAAEAPQGSELERAEWVFSWLSEHIEYGDRDSYYFKRGHQLCDALVDGDCVCTGYADAMYYLCNLVGVDCIVVCGLANDPKTAGGIGDHAWNQARINGTWYVFDPTFNDTMPVGSGVPLCFGMSSAAMQTVGGHKPAWEFTDETLIPACETGLDLAAAQNDTPEGALRTWLRYAAYAALDPSYLLLYAGLMTEETEVTPSADGMSAELDVPYADWAAWAARFMGEAAGERFPLLFSESEDGRLIVSLSGPPDGVDWQKLKTASVTEENGVFTADLGAAAARFTVSRTDEGLYRVETIEIR